MKNWAGNQDQVSHWLCGLSEKKAGGDVVKMKTGGFRILQPWVEIMFWLGDYRQVI